MDVNWITKVITVYKTDTFMSFAGGSVYDMDTNGFRLAVLAEEDNEAGMIWQNVFNHNTVVTLAGIDYARIIEIINGYTITFDDTGGAWVCNLLNSNNNVLDVTNLTSVQVRSNNSAGLVAVREIENTAYAGRVAIDVANGAAGTQYPLGTTENPVSNITDAKTIASTRGYTRLRFLETAFTVGASDDVSNYVVEGIYHDRSVMTLTAGCTITDTQFNDLAVQGDAGSDFCVFENCSLRTITNFNSNVYRSEIGGTIGLNLSTFRHWINCASNQNTGTPVLDFQSTTQNLIISNYVGDIKIRNFTGGSLELFCNSAQVEIESSCIGGTISLYGTVGLTDNSVGTTVDDSNAVSPFTNWAHVLEGTIGADEMMRVMAAVLWGKASGMESNSPVFRSIMDTKDRVTATTDQHGNRTSTSMDGT